FAMNIFSPQGAGTCTAMDKLAYRSHDGNTTGFTIAVMNGTGGALTTYNASVGAVDLGSDGSSWAIGDSKVFYYQLGSAPTSPLTIDFTYTSAGFSHNESTTCTFS
ncbi:MAG: hypothetical protein ABIA76_04925, partial [Candidatus Diapherotrites archaeon]